MGTWADAERSMGRAACTRTGGLMTRLEAAKGKVDGQCKFARIHEHQVCKGPEHVMQELQRVEALGGEGGNTFYSKRTHSIVREHIL